MSDKPAVGRIVVLHLSGNPHPLAGIVCAVHARGINVAGFDQLGVQYRACGVQCVREGHAAPASGSWVEWPPYGEADAVAPAATEQTSDRGSDPSPSGDTPT